MFPTSSNRSFPYIDDENPNSGGEEQPPSSFLHFPGAFLDDDELLDTHLLPQRQLMLEGEQSHEINSAAAAAAASNKTTSSDDAADEEQQQQQKKPLEVLPPMKKSDDVKKPVPRKRTGKKDRHSKIYTAQGPRDRRMRLSLQIARKFFDLQDMLGFDKASKTIEWLFTKSKAAIKELTGNLPQIKHIGGGGGGGGGTTASSISETKGASRSKEISHNRESSVLTTPKEKKNRKPRIKSAVNPVAKESREKARARARERTREKMIMRSLEKSKKCSEANPNNLEHSSSLETGEASGSRSREMSSSLEMAAEVEEQHSTHSLEHQMATVGIIEKFLGIPTSSSSSSSIYNYSPNNFPCFPGNWDMDNSRIHSGYSAMGPSTGNFQDQNPTSVFMTTTNVRPQNPTSVFMTTNLRLESQFQDQNSGNPLDGNRNHRLC